jgi:hypothetical protein
VDRAGTVAPSMVAIGIGFRRIDLAMGSCRMFSPSAEANAVGEHVNPR